MGNYASSPDTTTPRGRCLLAEHVSGSVPSTKSRQSASPASKSSRTSSFRMDSDLLGLEALDLSLRPSSLIGSTSSTGAATTGAAATATTGADSETLLVYSRAHSCSLASSAIRPATSERDLLASFQGRNLADLTGKQGTFKTSISQQLSTLSRYSIVSSNDGSVVISKSQPREHISLGTQIGEGAFGKVYLAEYQGTPVAVKVVTGEDCPDNPASRLNCAVQWQYTRKEKSMELESVLMAAVAHPHIVKTLKVLVARGPGQTLEGLDCSAQARANKPVQADSFCAQIVMEYCDLGTLSQAAVQEFCFHSATRDSYRRSVALWDAWAVLQTLREVTSGLIELEKLQIVHGDLKPLNIMLCSSNHDRRCFVPKLTDFGLSRVLQRGQKDIHTETMGTVTHMPPELLMSGAMSSSQDVYAMGIIMWECFSGEVVYKGLREAQVVVGVTMQELRPEFPPDAPPGYRALAERCWATAPEERPTLLELAAELAVLQESLCPADAESPRLEVALPSGFSSKRRGQWPRTAPVSPAASQRESHCGQATGGTPTAGHQRDSHVSRNTAAGGTGRHLRKLASTGDPSRRRSIERAAAVPAQAPPANEPSQQLQPPQQQQQQSQQQSQQQQQQHAKNSSPRAVGSSAERVVAAELRQLRRSSTSELAEKLAGLCCAENACVPPVVVAAQGDETPCVATAAEISVNVVADGMTMPSATASSTGSTGTSTLPMVVRTGSGVHAASRTASTSGTGQDTTNRRSPQRHGSSTGGGSSQQPSRPREHSGTGPASRRLASGRGAVEADGSLAETTRRCSNLCR